MGMPHETFCTLCGVPFWLRKELIDYTRKEFVDCTGEQSGMAWFSLYVARK